MNRSKRNDLINDDGSSVSKRRAFLAAGVGAATASLLTLLTVGAGGAHAQQPAGAAAGQAAGSGPSPATSSTKVEQEIINLSRDKWRWMSERKVDTLAGLFHDKAVFVHMGGAMSRTQELDVIRSGRIQYKDAQIRESSARIIGTTAIVLSTIRLVAVVGGNEVTNPFVVTEVYVQQGGAWKLAQLSFTRTFG